MEGPQRNRPNNSGIHVKKMLDFCDAKSRGFSSGIKMNYMFWKGKYSPPSVSLRFIYDNVFVQHVKNNEKHQ